MSNGAIVRRNPGQYIPDAVLELMIQNNPGGWGAAIIDKDGLKTNNGGKEELNLAFFKETMEAFPDCGISFYFASVEGAINEDDIFPQTLMADDDGNPQLCVLIDANLPGFVKKGSALSAETHFVDDWLRVKLGEIVEKHKLADDNGNADIPKLMSILGKDDFRKEVLSQCVSRGSIQIISDKTALTFATGDSSREFPWGWMSNTYGYGKEEKKAPRDMFAKKTKANAPGTGDQPSVIEVPKKEETIPPKDGDTALYTIKKQFPGPNVSRNDRRNWYKYRIGYHPQGWEQSIPVETYIDQKGKTVPWKEFQRDLQNLGLPKLNNPPKAGEEPENKQVVFDHIPMLSPKARDYMNAELDKPEIQKIISETGDVVATAEQAKKMEEKIADFCTQLGRKGLTMLDIMKLPHEWHHRVATERPDISAAITFNLKSMLLPRLVKEAKAPKEEPEVVKSEVTGDGTQETKKAPRDMFAKKPKAA